MKLVDNADKAWKWISVHAMAWPASVAAVWLMIPEKWQDIFLANVTPKQIVVAVLVILVVGILGRLIKQGE